MHLIRKDRNLVLAGAAVLILGLFCPTMTLPYAGPVNFFAGAKISAPVLLALALIAAGLALNGRVRDALWPGIAAAALLTYHFGTLLTNLRMRGDAAEAAAAFQSAPVAAAAAVQVEWGWLVLALGAGMVIFAGASSHRAARVPAFAARMDGARRS